MSIFGWSSPRLTAFVVVDPSTRIVHRYVGRRGSGVQRTHRAEFLSPITQDNRVDIEHFRLYPDANVQYAEELGPEDAA